MRRLMWVYAVLVALAMVMPAGALGQAPDFRERVSEELRRPRLLWHGCKRRCARRVPHPGLGDRHDDPFHVSMVDEQYTYQGKTVVLHEVGRSQATVVEGTGFSTSPTPHWLWRAGCARRR